VELSTSTIYDTVALRTQREFLRNVFDGKQAEVSRMNCTPPCTLVSPYHRIPVHADCRRSTITACTIGHMLSSTVNPSRRIRRGRSLRWFVRNICSHSPISRRFDCGRSCSNTHSVRDADVAIGKHVYLALMTRTRVVFSSASHWQGVAFTALSLSQ
jgi:hypothetical protein